MPLGELTDPEAVLQAMAEFDDLGREAFLAKHGFGASYRYTLVHEGREYDSKAIAGVAVGYQHPESGPLSNKDFSGGLNGAAGTLRALGFEVRDGEGLTDPVSNNPIQHAFEAILADYARARIRDPFGKEHELWKAMDSAVEALENSEPVRQRPNLFVKASLGVGNWAKVPWISIIDSRITTSTRMGVYCVYLFRQDMTGVYVTFNQGVSKLNQELGRKQARETLRTRADSIGAQSLDLLESRYSLDDLIDLRADAGLGAQYENSTIAYRLYDHNEVPTDKELLRDLEPLLHAYDRYVDSDPKDPHNEFTLEGGGTLEEVVVDFSSALKESHVAFGAHHERLVRSFVASLATKNFVILTGLSGSGKTQIALRFGDWLGAERRRLIPVRPDWTGSEAMFGFEDALQAATDDGRRVWHVPGALAFMLRAAADPHQPYLLILDEMNLAHVERYFADVLSGMESGDPVLPNLQREGDGLWRPVPDVEPLLAYPRNLFIVGTVNVDETTYMFSPKILDRANVFEFRVEANDLQTDLRKPVACREGDDGLVQTFLSIAMDDRWQLDHPSPDQPALASHLRSVHSLLGLESFEFGFRVFYEATRFAAILTSAGEAKELAALDLQIMQKVLPRLHGSRRKLEPVLKSLGLFAFQLEVDPASAEMFDPEQLREIQPILPISFDKIRRMTHAVRANQFASFTE